MGELSAWAGTTGAARSGHFTRHSLDVDPARTVREIVDAIRLHLRTLKRRGAVVGLSGGVDSSVVGALLVKAVGPERVLALLMPERDSSGESLRLGRLVAERLGVEARVEDITPALEGLGAYARQEEAIQTVFPEYTDGYRCKLTLPSIVESARLNVSQLTVESPSGEARTSRMPAVAYQQLVAATNFKQRVRKAMEYYHADRLGYAVAGTPNRLEHELGFFVKQGDGAADIKPIAHLYKTQVYALARHLDVPGEVCARPPTTDTFSMEQTQEEFYFSLPYDRMDLCLWAYHHDVPAEEAGRVVDLTPEQVRRVFRDIEAKRRVAHYLSAPPLLVAAPDRG